MWSTDIHTCIAIGILTITWHCNWPQFNWVKETDNTASVQWGLTVCFGHVFTSQYVTSVYSNLNAQVITTNVRTRPEDGSGVFFLFTFWDRALFIVGSSNHWIRSFNLKVFCYFVFFLFCCYRHVLLWGHWYPRFGLLVMSHVGFIARSVSLIGTWQRHVWCMFPGIHHWCNTC